jgi:ribonuclease BN (tRNA processing enzyme)
MHVRLLGTGTAFHEDGRGSQCILLEPGGGATTLVDVGPSAPMAMSRFGVDPGRVGQVFFTHLHGDHTAGWPFLLLDFAFRSRRTAPIDVWGARGMRETLVGLTRLCYQSLLDRPPFEVRYRELERAEVEGKDATGLAFDALPMLHDESSLGYRFRCGEATVAISGDTGWCDNLERLSRGADMLIVECTTVGRQDHPHVSLDELRERAAGLASERIVLVHLPDEVAEELARDPVPRVVAGYDGLALEV